MSRVLVVGAGPDRHETLRSRLAAAGFQPIMREDEGLGAAFDDLADVEALVVGRALSNCEGFKRLGCLERGIPMVSEGSIACLNRREEGPFNAPNHYAIDDLLAPTLPQLLGTALAQYREVARLRREVENRTSAIGLIMGGLFQVRTLEEAGNLSTMLSIACPDPARVVVGLRELIVNAIEHGNLGITCEEKGDLIREGRWREEIERRLELPEYRDRCATVQFRRERHRAIFQVRDEGAGFDFTRYMKFDPLRLMAPNGRGIALAASMSFDSLTYIGAGNDVVAIANFTRARG
jgi:anti-sigma regulatory factor (Ser/Thr protein kinase)